MHSLLRETCWRGQWSRWYIDSSFLMLELALDSYISHFHQTWLTLLEIMKIFFFLKQVLLPGLYLPASNTIWLKAKVQILKWAEVHRDIQAHFFQYNFRFTVKNQQWKLTMANHSFSLKFNTISNRYSLNHKGKVQKWKRSQVTMGNHLFSVSYSVTGECDYHIST